MTSGLNSTLWNYSKYFFSYNYHCFQLRYYKSPFVSPVPQVAHGRDTHS